jgi:hypothetical protein
MGLGLPKSLERNYEVARKLNRIGVASIRRVGSRRTRPLVKRIDPLFRQRGPAESTTSRTIGLE